MAPVALAADSRRRTPKEARVHSLASEPLTEADVAEQQADAAEDVVSEVVAEVEESLDARAAVDERFADRLLVVLALAGVRVTIPGTTDHVETNLGVFEAFGFDVTVSDVQSGEYCAITNYNN